MPQHELHCTAHFIAHHPREYLPRLLTVIRQFLNSFEYPNLCSLNAALEPFITLQNIVNINMNSLPLSISLFLLIIRDAYTHPFLQLSDSAPNDLRQILQLLKRSIELDPKCPVELVPHLVDTELTEPSEFGFWDLGRTVFEGWETGKKSGDGGVRFVRSTVGL
jgi:hypothetical protein